MLSRGAAPQATGTPSGKLTPQVAAATQERARFTMSPAFGPQKPQGGTVPSSSSLGSTGGRHPSTRQLPTRAPPRLRYTTPCTKPKPALGFDALQAYAGDKNPGWQGAALQGKFGAVSFRAEFGCRPGEKGSHGSSGSEPTASTLLLDILLTFQGWTQSKMFPHPSLVSRP